MKYHALFVIFEKNCKIRNCRLLQIIGGALWVKDIENTRSVSFDIKFTRQGFENAY